MALHVRLLVGAVQGQLSHGSTRLHQLGERVGQFTESAAEDPDAVRQIGQVRDKGRLGGLVGSGKPERCPAIGGRRRPPWP